MGNPYPPKSTSAKGITAKEQPRTHHFHKIRQAVLFILAIAVGFAAITFIVSNLRSPTILPTLVALDNTPTTNRVAGLVAPTVRQASSTPAATLLAQNTGPTKEFLPYVTKPSPGTGSGPLRVSKTNPRYFEDQSGKIVYLTGSHTWSNLQDNGGSFPPPVFDYPAYLDFLTKNNHDFFRLWTWEQARWTLETSDNNYWFDPMPYTRTGPGSALDGKAKFDLTKFNQAYFDRMRQRIQQAGERGIYVSVMLFDGWSVASDKGGTFHANNPWKGHPFNINNNINGINGDPHNSGNGLNTQDLSIPAVTAIQEAYVKKVIDTVNDLDNVLYEIDNEGDGTSVDWQDHLIQFIKSYEASKPKQHPVGMTAAYPGGWNPDLFDGPADWVSPNNDNDYLSDPPAADGKKVVLTDTDHLCGVCGDRSFIWKSFTRGLNPIFMDAYDGAGYGVGGEGFHFADPNWVSARANMGYTLMYARKINLAKMTPQGGLCSTGYCLAYPAASGAEFLVYAPSGGIITVDLTSIQGTLSTEWLNPGEWTNHFRQFNHGWSKKKF